jgi:hypothetical protein
LNVVNHALMKIMNPLQEISSEFYFIFFLENRYKAIKEKAQLYHFMNMFSS